MGSRRCRLKTNGNQWIVEDAGGERYTARAGDQIQMGSVTIRPQADPAALDQATVGIMNDLINHLLASGPAAPARKATAAANPAAEQRKAG